MAALAKTAPTEDARAMFETLAAVVMDEEALRELHDQLGISSVEGTRKESGERENAAAGQMRALAGKKTKEKKKKEEKKKEKEAQEEEGGQSMMLPTLTLGEKMVLSQMMKAKAKAAVSEEERIMFETIAADAVDKKKMDEMQKAAGKGLSKNQCERRSRRNEGRWT